MDAITKKQCEICKHVSIKDLGAETVIDFKSLCDIDNKTIDLHHVCGQFELTTLYSGEFIRMFLPDFQKKYDDYPKSGRQPILFWKENFHEALQNYTDKICEQQRINCREAYKELETNIACNAAILWAEQPEIDDALLAELAKTE